ncbi:hypothetical protein CCMA1212_003906 [Trichoderma ghanense]|uniref:Uncharacterized protein n=1 Tax=Trichoderma ghanense TaxID=65468 RepID=A0ABY2H8P3_9HYPO
MYPGPWLLSPKNTPCGRYETIHKPNRQHALPRCFSNQGSWCTFCLTCIRSLQFKKQLQLCKQGHVLQPRNCECYSRFSGSGLVACCGTERTVGPPLVSSPPLDSAPLA